MNSNNVENIKNTNEDLNEEPNPINLAPTLKSTLNKDISDNSQLSINQNNKKINNEKKMKQNEVKLSNEHTQGINSEPEEEFIQPYKVKRPGVSDIKNSQSQITNNAKENKTFSHTKQKTENEKSNNLNTEDIISINDDDDEEQQLHQLPNPSMSVLHKPPSNRRYDSKEQVGANLDSSVRPKKGDFTPKSDSEENNEKNSPNHNNNININNMSTLKKSLIVNQANQTNQHIHNSSAMFYSRLLNKAESSKILI
jgi:hypothetical protein